MIENPKATANAGPDIIVTGNERYTVTAAAVTGGLVLWTTDPPVPIENAVTLTSTIGPFTANTTLTVDTGGECGAKAQARVVYRACTFEAKLLAKGVLCQDETDTLGVQVSGGAGDYAYEWRLNNAPVSESSRYPVSGPGTYSVVVTDSKGCQASPAPVTLVTSPRPVLSVSGEKAFCKGGSTPLTASASGGTAPYTYTWKNETAPVGTANPLVVNAAGRYTLSVVDARGCTATSAAVNVTEKGGDLTALIVPAGSTTVMLPATLTLNANTGLGYAYQWQKDGQAIAGATSASYVASQSGSYVVVVSRDGCLLPSAAVVVRTEVATGLEPAGAPFELKAFPNPTRGIFRMEVSLEKPGRLTVNLSDLSGRRLIPPRSETPSVRHVVEVDLSRFPAGLYKLEAEAGDRRVVRKVLKTD